MIDLFSTVNKNLYEYYLLYYIIWQFSSSFHVLSYVALVKPSQLISRDEVGALVSKHTIYTADPNPPPLVLLC